MHDDDALITDCAVLFSPFAKTGRGVEPDELIRHMVAARCFGDRPSILDESDYHPDWGISIVAHTGNFDLFFTCHEDQIHYAIPNLALAGMGEILLKMTMIFNSVQYRLAAYSPVAAEGGMLAASATFALLFSSQRRTVVGR